MIRTIGSRDLTQDQRTKGARKARETLKGFLSNPFLTAEQIHLVHEKINAVGRWERLEVEASPPAKPGPKNHKVEVTEVVSTKEKVA